MESKISKLAARLTGRTWVAVLASIVLGAIVLLPGLGRSGLWEPGERQLADRIAPPDSIEAQQAELRKRTQPPSVPTPPPLEAKCKKAPPDDAIARTANPRAMKLGRDEVDDTDAGRKQPFALLGLLTLLATAGIAIRLGGARAGIVSAVIVLSMPLLVLQSRMLTNDIATVCGATLVVYGLLSLYRVRDAFAALFEWRTRRREFLIAWFDFKLGVAALALGLSFAFVGGGALLGLLVPIGAVAVAGKLGVPFVTDAGKLVYNVALRVGRKQRWAIGRLPLAYAGPGNFAPFLATLAAIALLVLLARHLYDFTDPYPGITPPVRRIGDIAIVPEGCWSWLLGAVWRPEEDLRYGFDSSFEQVAYGTFPWGIMAPIAMVLLLRDPDGRRRLVGALTLAWAGGAWIAAEAFHRKVGLTLYAGFPAMAIAIGVWLDGFLDRRRHDDDTSAGHILLGVFFSLAVLQFGKDIWSFPDKMTSLLAGTEIVQYPANARLLFLKLKMWPLALGMLVAGSFTASLVLWRSGDSPFAKRMRDLATKLAAIAIGASVIVAAFWAFAWHGRLSEHLSSKALFDTYKALREPGDQLIILGELGHAPIAYADAPRQPNAPPGSPQQLGYEKALQRDQIVQALKRPNRVFAIAQNTELCSLHREIGDQPYFVIDDRNTRHMLFSNKLAGASDRNPLREMIVHAEPQKIQYRPKGKVVWDNRIELLGWDIPKTVRRGAPFEVTIYYKILEAVGGNWTSIMHFDGAIRFNGDHKPIQDRCPTSTWQPGDYIVDKHTVIAGGAGHPLGRYDLWIGFFTGTAPNFKNMSISAAPGDMRDTTDRVKITSVLLD